MVPHPIRLLSMWPLLEVTLSFANMTDNHLGRREPVRKVQTCQRFGDYEDSNVQENYILLWVATVGCCFNKCKGV